MSESKAQPTYRRQRFLLAFIRQLQGSVASTDLQKLVFLNTMVEGLDFYEFIPYKYGAYSFQLSEDLEILQRDGYLTIESTSKTNRIKAIGDYQSGASFRIAAERGDKLIRKAYREYPYFAIKSEITKRIFDDEEFERFNGVRLQYIKTNQALFTIGYEGKSIEAFINTLIQNDIHLLCDVRMNPLSRKFGFSKGKLAHIADTVGIKYIHVPGLGIESAKRDSLETVEDYKRLFIDYAKTLPCRTLLLEHVYALLQSNMRVALMCYEKEPKMCHRHVIRDYIVNTYRVESADL